MLVFVFHATIRSRVTDKISKQYFHLSFHENECPKYIFIQRPAVETRDPKTSSRSRVKVHLNFQHSRILPYFERRIERGRRSKHVSVCHPINSKGATVHDRTESRKLPSERSSRKFQDRAPIGDKAR